MILKIKFLKIFEKGFWRKLEGSWEEVGRKLEGSWEEVGRKLGAGKKFLGYNIYRKFEGDAFGGDAFGGDAFEGNAFEGNAFEGNAFEGNAFEGNVPFRELRKNQAGGEMWRENESENKSKIFPETTGGWRE